MNQQRTASQDGVFTVQFAVVLVALLSMVGLALDVTNLYSRQAAMKSYAESAALAAAHELDGTQAGLEAAVQEAQDIINASPGLSADGSLQYSGALNFGATPDGPWMTPDEAAGLSTELLARIRFAQVNTENVGGSAVQFARFFAAQETLTFSETAVAGQTLQPILPLAVCAMSADAVSARKVPDMVPDTYELVEYGFRRGVSYNLLNLNPNGNTPANFVVNPVEFPEDGHTHNADNFEPEVVRPFICSGSMMSPNGNQLYVRPNFPLALIPDLNSRFKLPSGCHSTVAWPDKNVMEYKLTAITWLNYKPLLPYAQVATDAPTLVPLANLNAAKRFSMLPDDPQLRTRQRYGTLWAYARPVQYSNSAPGHVGAPFSTSAMAKLYPVDSTTVGEPGSEPDIVLSGWSTGPRPYIFRGVGTSTTPTGTSVLFRRIVNIPLLQCPVTGNVATVLGLGNFLLTSSAVAEGPSPYIAAEFGGMSNGTRPLITRLYR